MENAVIILGHGSKAPEALETLRKYQEIIKQVRIHDVVEIASLQFDKPELPDAIETVVKMGVKRIIIVPLFLYNGIHLQEDIPGILDIEKQKYPDVEIIMAGNLGTDTRIAEVVVDRISEVS